MQSCGSEILRARPTLKLSYGAKILKVHDYYCDLIAFLSGQPQNVTDDWLSDSKPLSLNVNW